MTGTRLSLSGSPVKDRKLFPTSLLVSLLALVGAVFCLAQRELHAGEGAQGAASVPARAGAPNAEKAPEGGDLEVRKLLGDLTGSGDRKFQAMRRLAALSRTDRLSAFRKGLKSGDREVRTYCAFQLGGLGYSGVLKDLGRLSLLDEETTVRETAARAYRRVAEADPYGRHPYGLILPYLKAMERTDPELRIRAIEALGFLGQASAVPALLGAFQGGGSGGYRAPSNHVFIGSERALVTDFDVEIAQAAVIADPKISHVRSGAQLEARVLAVDAQIVLRQKIAVGRALGSLTGENFGADAAMWKMWWETLGSKDPRYADLGPAIPGAAPPKKTSQRG